MEVGSKNDEPISTNFDFRTSRRTAVHAQADQASPTDPKGHLVVSLQGGSPGGKTRPSSQKTRPLPARAPAGRRAWALLTLTADRRARRQQAAAGQSASKRER